MVLKGEVSQLNPNYIFQIANLKKLTHFTL